MFLFNCLVYLHLQAATQSEFQLMLRYRKPWLQSLTEWKAEPEIMEDIYNTGLSQALILRQLKKSSQMAASPGSVLPLLL